MPKSNYEFNKPRLVKFLRNKGYVYTILDEYEHHFRIRGDTALVDVWPSRMKYHVVESEYPDDGRYKDLNYYFSPKELEQLLTRSD